MSRESEGSGPRNLSLTPKIVFITPTSSPDLTAWECSAEHKGC